MPHGPSKEGGGGSPHPFPPPPPPPPPGPPRPPPPSSPPPAPPCALLGDWFLTLPRDPLFLYKNHRPIPCFTPKPESSLASNQECQVNGIAVSLFIPHLFQSK